MDSLNLTKDAISQIDSLIKRDPGNYGAWFRKGELAINISDTALAIRSFSSAANIYSNPDVILTLANLYAAQKNKLALELCNSVIAQKPDRSYTAHTYYIIGLYFGNPGNTKNAIDNFNSCPGKSDWPFGGYTKIVQSASDRRKACGTSYCWIGHPYSTA
jgi:tetratricopeptide (TPR) repeat protein